MTRLPKAVRPAAESARSAVSRSFACVKTATKFVGFVQASVYIGVVAVEIVPLMLLADAFTLYPILLLISLGLGTLFSVVIQDIHWLKGRHHVFALLLLPVTAIVATVLVIRFADTYAVQFSSLKTVAHDPLLVGVVFGLGIVLPYAFHLATGHRRRHAS